MRDSHAEIDAPRRASGPERRRARPGAVEEPMVEKAEVTTSQDPRTSASRFSRADFAEPLSPLFERELEASMVPGLSGLSGGRTEPRDAPEPALAALPLGR